MLPERSTLHREGATGFGESEACCDETGERAAKAHSVAVRRSNRFVRSFVRIILPLVFLRYDRIE